MSFAASDRGRSRTSKTVSPGASGSWGGASDTDVGRSQWPVRCISTWSESENRSSSRRTFRTVRPNASKRVKYKSLVQSSASPRRATAEGRAPIRLALRPFVFGEARLNDSKQGRRTACEALGRPHAPANESTECSPRCRRPGRRGFCFRAADSAPPCSAKGTASAHPSASDCAAIAAP
jgi:hypothetical protein